MPTDFRQIILSRLNELHQSRYWLAEKLQDQPSRSSLYAYLRGDTDMRAADVARIFDALHLGVCVQNRRPKKG